MEASSLYGFRSNSLRPPAMPGTRTLIRTVEYLSFRLAFDNDAIGPKDLDIYATASSAAGAMRAGFEVYRAVALKKHGRLIMPVLALGGTASFYLPIAKEMLAEVAKNVTGRSTPECGHWIAEEDPTALIAELFNFASKSYAGTAEQTEHNPTNVLCYGADVMLPLECSGAGTRTLVLCLRGNVRSSL